MILNVPKFFAPQKIPHLLITLAVLALISAGVAGFKLQNPTQAANPAFALNQSGSYIVGESGVLILALNGTGEGSGLLGAETYITYTSSKVQVTSVNFGSCAFDTCLDFSEEGILKLLGASGPSGKNVSTAQTFATIQFNLLESGSVPFTFTQSNVITGAQVVESRTATSTTIAILTVDGALCGNNLVQTGEQCDDGNATNGDGCSSACQIEAPVPPVPPACGNGIIEGGETCDDGNATSGDGCSNACQIEAPVPPVPPACGNEITEEGETCDDGNVASGDGCSDICQTEAPVPPVVKTLSSINISIGSGYSSTVEVDGFTQLNTFAFYSDDSSSNITSPPPVIYTSSNPGVASVSGSRAYGHIPGSATITASYTENAVTRTDTQSITVITAPVPEPEPEVIPEPAPEPEVIPEPAPGVTPPEGGATGTTGTTAEEALRPSAPEALVVQEPVPLIATPETEELRQEAIAECTNAYPGVNFSDPGADDDGDGLSNRMECYAKTNPTKYDTDDDGCSDGDEVLQLFQDPLDSNDCALPTLDRTIKITDPQADWLIPNLTPRLSGIAPLNAQKVRVVLIEADQLHVNDILTSLTPLSEKNLSPEDREKRIQELETALQKSEGFIEEFEADLDVVAFKQAVTEMKTEIEKLRTSQDYNPSLATIEALVKPAYTAESTELYDTFIGESPAKNFQLVSPALADKKAYLAVAEATLGDGTTVVSPAVRFIIDTAFSIIAPRPQKIGGVSVDPSSAFIPAVLAQMEGVPEIVIKQLKPLVVGDAEFSSQVFAVWNSLVLASSVIADSEAGAFSIRAPRNLEEEISHKVTLYAVKVKDDKKIRSESVEILFRITPPVFNTQIALWGLWILLLLLLISYAIRKALNRKPAEAAPVLPVTSAPVTQLPITQPPVVKAPSVTQPLAPGEGLELTDEELRGHEALSAQEAADPFKAQLREEQMAEEAEQAEMKAIQGDAHAKRQKQY